MLRVCDQKCLLEECCNLLIGIGWAAPNGNGDMEIGAVVKGY